MQCRARTSIFFYSAASVGRAAGGCRPALHRNLARAPATPEHSQPASTLSFLACPLARALSGGKHEDAHRPVKPRERAKRRFDGGEQPVAIMRDRAQGAADAKLTHETVAALLAIAPGCAVGLVLRTTTQRRDDEPGGVASHLMEHEELHHAPVRSDNQARSNRPSGARERSADAQLSRRMFWQPPRSSRRRRRLRAPR